MRKGCLYGLGCLVVIATSPVWVPSLLLGLAYLAALLSALLDRI